MKNKFVVGAVTLQIFILLAIFLVRQLTLVFGTEIQLKPRIYDPRDIFYGDYVQLQFQINRYRTSTPIDPYRDLFKRDKRVYAVLQPEGDDWSVKYISFKKPVEKPYLAGKIKFIDGQEIWLLYGFERYYIEEGTGKQFESLIRDQDKDVRVAIAIGPGGRAVVKGLRVGGQPYQVSPKRPPIPDRF